MFIPTIGLEIHAELKTKTKMFCGCKNNPLEATPNVNVCPICLGHPGTLPTINKEALRLMLKIGLALGGKIASYSHFDRKSYFYPDLPKGYQISQYESPLIENAVLNNIRIKRIHLEEDTGKLIHLPNVSLVDFNRAGVPLMELVTEPDIKTAEEAVNFAESLQSILRYLDASDADMEKGQMRIEVNISLSSSTQNLGTKVEIKNINSFRAVYEAIEYEIERQTKILEKGEKIKQETRGWNDIKKITVSQRFKETADDYRYFPEPDLPPLKITDSDIFNLEELKKSIPELPSQKKERFKKEYLLPETTVNILVKEKEIADYFEKTVSELKEKDFSLDIKTLANYLTNDVLGILKQENVSFTEMKITPEHFAHLIYFIEKGILSSRMAKDILLLMFQTGEDPENILLSKNIKLISNESELEKVVEEAIKENEKSVLDYKKGKENALQFLVGQVMKKTKGNANPQLVKELLQKKLSL